MAQYPEAARGLRTLNTVMMGRTCLSSGRKSLAAMMSLFSCLMTRSHSMPFWLACRARAHRRSRHAAFTTFARPTSSTSPKVCACSHITQQSNPCSRCACHACNPAGYPACNNAYNQSLLYNKTMRSNDMCACGKTLLDDGPMQPDWRRAHFQVLLLK